MTSLDQKIHPQNMMFTRNQSPGYK